MWVPDVDTARALFPQLHAAGPDVGSWVAVPVQLEERLVGVLGFVFADEHDFTEAERLYLLALADVAARPLSSALALVDDASDLRHRLDEATAASMERGATLVAVTHELSGPLASIAFRAAAVMVLARRCEIDRVLQHAERIEAEAVDIGRMVAMLGSLHLNDPLGGPARSPVDLFALTRRVVDAMAVENPRIVVRRTGESPAYVAANAFQMEHAVVNLLANAVRFAPRGSTIGVECAGHRDQVSLLVDDAGPGVSIEDRDKIFHAGWTSSPSHRGLGLFVARTFAEANGGRLRVGVSPFGGARFVLRLPSLSSD